MTVNERGHAGEERWLDPAQVRCRRSPRGGLQLQVGDQEYREFTVRRAFPLEDENRFIGFFLPDGNEIGLLENPGELDPDSWAALQEELEKIYFRPRITSFLHLTEEHGVLRGEIETASGIRPLEIRGWRENVRMLSGNRAIVEDVDGNRYFLDDWRLLPKQTREILGL
ncbi:MAG: DUF1854 domain-containing protein [Candidatus Latescibacterota bacterium]|jgi:hypothetical protein